MNDNSTMLNYRDGNQKTVLWDRISLSQALQKTITFDFKATDVVLDSRLVKPGDLFLGLNGERYNGGQFAEDAILKGAVACLVDHIYGSNENDQQKIILVSNVAEALNMMAKYTRKNIQAKVIGVTGSVGKTSTKEMLKIAMQNQGEVFASTANQNNHYGLPLSLVRTSASTQYCIFEMGMNHAGEIALLSEIAKPDFAIITTISPAHLEFFHSIEDIARAKAEIFIGMSAERGVAVLNIDNQYHQILASEAKNRGLKIINFGKDEKADIRLQTYAVEDGKSTIKASCCGTEINYQLGAVGEHMVFNSLAVLATIAGIGKDVKKAATDLNNFSALNGRGELQYLKQDMILLDECYNASPASVEAALQTLGLYKNIKQKKRLVAVLGDMMELGKDSLKFHLALSNHIVNNKIDKVFTVGEMMHNLFKKLPHNLRAVHANNSEEMSDIILKYLEEGDVILIKGSQSIGMQKIKQELMRII